MLEFPAQMEGEKEFLLQTGDVVRLRSGGPKMCIEGFLHLQLDAPPTLARCIWWEPSVGCFLKQEFCSACLEEADGEKQP